jgi:hypothetical protein
MKETLIIAAVVLTVVSCGAFVFGMLVFAGGKTVLQEGAAIQIWLVSAVLLVAAAVSWSGAAVSSALKR